MDATKTVESHRWCCTGCKIIQVFAPGEYHERCVCGSLGWARVTAAYGAPATEDNRNVIADALANNWYRVGARKTGFEFPKFSDSRRPTAAELMTRAGDILKDRAAQRDLPKGERTIGRAVEMFNTLTSHKLTQVEGWQFMILLKMCRAQSGTFRGDDHDDLIGYAALSAEAAYAESDGA